MKALTTILLILLTITATAQIHVRPAATGTGSGADWANATTLESTTVANAPSGTAIWVQAGTYNLSATLLVPQGVRLYGGFAGTETEVGERNFAENTTVIDANDRFAAVTLGANALLSGVTVQNGFANTTGRMSGGGVLMRAGARIEYSHIINNRAGERGGGVFAEGNVQIFNSVIADNKAGVDGFAVSGDAVFFYGNTVVGNALLDAMYLVCEEPHALTLVSPTFTANQIVDIYTSITNIVYLRAGSVTAVNVTWTGTESPTTPPVGLSVLSTAATTTISGTPTVAGTFGFTIATVANACQPVSQSGTIAVTLLDDCLDPHTLTLTSATATIAQTLNINTAITNTVFTRGGSAAAVVVTWTGTANAATAPEGITVSSLTANPITISGTPTVAGTFGFTIATVANACEPVLQTGVIVALTGDEVCEDPHTLTLTSSAGSIAQTVYINAPISNIIYSRGGDATAVIITWTGTANPTTAPAGITVSSATTNPITISGTPTTAGTFGFTIATVANACATVQQTGTIVAVSPDDVCVLPHTLTLTSPAATANQTLDVNTTLENIVFTRGGAATAVAITWAGTANAVTPPAGITVSTDGIITTISGTPSTVGTFGFVIRTLDNACPSVALTGTIAVTALDDCLSPHTLTLSSAPATIAQTVNINTALTNTVFTRGGGAEAVIMIWTGTEDATSPPAGLTVSPLTANPITISGTPTVAGTFGFTIATVANACELVTQSGVILVMTGDEVCEEPHTLTLASGAGTNVQTVDINTPITNIVYVRGGDATAAIVTWTGTTSPTLPPAGISVSSAMNAPMIISGTPTVAGTFGFTVATAANACESTTQTGTIIALLPGEACVTPHTLTLTSPAATGYQTVDINTAIQNIVFTRGGGATAVSLTWTGTANATTPPAGVSVSTSGETTTVSGTPTVAGTFGFVITTVTNACEPVALMGKIAVTLLDDCVNTHTLTLTSAPPTVAQTVLTNTALTPITFTRGGGAEAVVITWTGTADAATPPAGLTVSSLTGHSITISGTPTVAGTFGFTMATVSNACEFATQSGVILVMTGDEVCENPHTITLISASGTNVQTLVNMPITDIVYTLGGDATAATVTWTGTANAATPPAGISVSSPMATPIVISGTPTVTGTFGFTISTLANACEPATQTGFILVLSPDDTCEDPHTLTLVSPSVTANQVIDLGDPITNIAYMRGGGITAVHFIWTGTANPTTPPAGISILTTGMMTTISGTPTVEGLFEFTIASVADACSSVSQSGTIAVGDVCENPHTLALTSPAGTASQNVCVNFAIDDIVFARGGGATAAAITWSGTADPHTAPAGLTVSSLTATPITISGTPTATGNFGFTISTVANACPSVSQTATINVHAVPAAPTGAGDARCGTGTLTISATSAGNQIQWFAAATGGSPLTTGTPNTGVTASGANWTTPSITTTTTYHAQAITPAGCVSATRTAVVATVNAVPAVTGTTPYARCGTGTVTLSATVSAGAVARWFANETGGVALHTGLSFTTPSILTNTTYWVEAHNATTGCTSPRTAVLATVHPIPAAPTGSPNSRCGTGTLTISATSAGNQIQWFSAATGGSPLTTGTPNTGVTASGANWTTPSISTTTIYHAQAITPQGCVSATRTSVVATVNAIPAAPTGSPNSRCGTGTLTISATSAGNQIQWFAAATGGSPLTTGTPNTGVTASGANWTTPSISTTTIYHAQAITPQGCVSATRTSVVATVNAIPAAPTGSPNSRCGTGTLTISATSAGNQIQWFSAATGGSPLTTGTPNTGVTASGANWTTPSISATTTYHAQAVTPQGCVSATRTAVVATVVEPTVTLTSPIATLNQNLDPNEAITAITFSRPSGTTTGFTIQWSGTANSSIPPAGIAPPVLTGTTLTISGTPTMAGVYGFIVSATPTPEASTCPLVALNGTIFVMTPTAGCNRNTPGWGAGGLGTITWGGNSDPEIGAVTIPGTGGRSTQVWSRSVAASACNKTDFQGGSTANFNADCRSALTAFYGNNFTWCAVMRFANQLCPPPFRVPTQQDFIDLDMNLGGSGSSISFAMLGQVFTDHLEQYIGSVLGQTGGIWNGFRFTAHTGTAALSTTAYWTSSHNGSISQGVLMSAGSLNPQANVATSLGLALRCVRWSWE